MKHLTTKLLLLLVGLFAFGLPSQAKDFYLCGGANGMKVTDENTTAGWDPSKPVVVSTDASNDVYFWAKGEFKISTSKSSTSDWGDYNRGALKLNGGNVTVGDTGNSYVGNTRTYVKLHVNGSSYSYETSTSPFVYFTPGSKIYIKLEPWWSDGNAIPQVTFKGTSDSNSLSPTKVGDYYVFTVPNGSYNKMYVSRRNPSGGEWNNVTVNVPSNGENLLTISGSGGTTNTSWSFYKEPYETPTDVYIIGTIIPGTPSSERGGHQVKMTKAASGNVWTYTTGANAGVTSLSLLTMVLTGQLSTRATVTALRKRAQT